MSRLIGGHLRQHVVGYVAVFIAMTGTSIAAFDPVGSDGDVDMCVDRKSGDVRVMKRSSCGKGETKLALSQTAPQGPQGPAGADGQNGVDGQPGATGAAGSDGQDGSPDTPAQVLDKLVQVDGSGSGLDADTLDGSGTAGGDLSGSFSNLQIGADRIGTAEIADSIGTQVISHEVDPDEAATLYLDPSDGSSHATAGDADEFLMPGPGSVAALTVESDTTANTGTWSIEVVRVVNGAETVLGSCILNGSSGCSTTTFSQGLFSNSRLVVRVVPSGPPTASPAMRISLLLRPFLKN